MSIKLALVLLAAGYSTRLGLGTKKEYLDMDSIIYPGQPGTVLSNAAEPFLLAADIRAVVITIPPSESAEKARSALFKSPSVKQCEKNIPFIFIPGGKTRQQSVYNALQKLSVTDSFDYVAIHDGARPYVSVQVIREAITTSITYGSAVPAIPAVDTLKEIDNRGFITRHLERKSMVAVQTPQIFRFDQILKAHKQAVTDGIEYTDDTAIYASYVSPVHISTGDICNKKITYAFDLPLSLKSQNQDSH